MSQMKGIFHSLAQQELRSKRIYGSGQPRAYAYCLERGSFISATYFVVDSVTAKTIRYSRAGHCPVLYHKASTGITEYLKDKGTALGMVRGNDYGRLVETNVIQYASGDIMVLYTDGITEAKNQRGEEFDYDRLADALREVTDKKPNEIEKNITHRLYEFSGSKDINDDYTSMTIKFK
jgi:sigma-B regulation protein RsbU (phosphoserine phosphatase)